MKNNKQANSNYNLIDQVNTKSNDNQSVLNNEETDNSFINALNKVQTNNSKVHNLTDISIENTREDSKEKKESQENKAQLVSEDKKKSLFNQDGEQFPKKNIIFVTRVSENIEPVALSKSLVENETPHHLNISDMTISDNRPRPDNNREEFIRMVYNSIIEGIIKNLKRPCLSKFFPKGTNKFYKKDFPSIREEEYTHMTIRKFLVEANKNNEAQLNLLSPISEKTILLILDKELHIFIDFYIGKTYNNLFKDFTTLEEDLKSKKVENEAYFKIVCEYFDKFQRTKKRKNKNKFKVKKPRTYNRKTKGDKKKN